MKKLSLLLAVLLAVSVFVLAACSPAEVTDVTVMTLKGPTGMGMAKLLSDSDAGKTENKYSYTIASAPDEISAELIKGGVDIAAVPTNLAAVLYKKTEGAVRIVAANTLGVLYVVENGDTVKSVADLEGKTVYATGQGSTPEYILNYILEKNGVTADVQYLTEHSELSAQLIAGGAAIGVLPEPNVSTVLAKNPSLRVAVDLTDEWLKVSENSPVQGCIVATSDFIENHADALAVFLDEYASSVDFANSDIAAASELVAGLGIVPDAEIAAAALPNCNIICETGEPMKSMINEFLTVLFDANPASVGGEMPGDGIYYTGN